MKIIFFICYSNILKNRRTNFILKPFKRWKNVKKVIFFKIFDFCDVSFYFDIDISSFKEKKMYNNLKKNKKCIQTTTFRFKIIVPHLSIHSTGLTCKVTYHGFFWFCGWEYFIKPTHSKVLSLLYSVPKNKWSCKNRINFFSQKKTTIESNLVKT